jgi:phage shock protein C
MLFGVCGGLGGYLAIDPTIVRLLALALLFTTGTGVFIAYLVFALVVPEATIEETA